MMNTIGLFGGTFNPIHNGHLHIARAFADELKPDSVIFLPAGDPYHKTQPQTPAKHRFAMVQAAIADETRFAVSDIDMVRDGATYTIDTVSIFRQHFPHAQLWWLLGMDSLLQLHTWKNWQTLVQQTNIAVAARDGTSLQQAPTALHSWIGEALQQGSLKILTVPEYTISSTQLREALAKGQNVQKWLPESVINYIQQHQLYR